MIAKQAVYLTGDRKKAVPEGHKDARLLLVREGHNIEEAEVEKYDGAESLVNAKAKGASVDEQRPASAASEASNVPKKAARAKKSSAAKK